MSGSFLPRCTKYRRLLRISSPQRLHARPLFGLETLMETEQSEQPGPKHGKPLSTLWQPDRGIEFDSSLTSKIWKPSHGVKFSPIAQQSSAHQPLRSALISAPRDSADSSYVSRERFHGTLYRHGPISALPLPDGQEVYPEALAEVLPAEIINEDQQTFTSSSLGLDPTRQLQSDQQWDVIAEDPSNARNIEPIRTSDNEVEMQQGIASLLRYQIPEDDLRQAMMASETTGTAYWRYSMYKNAKGDTPKVHYCTSKETTERIARLFLDKDVIGFDVEWKPNARDSDGIKKNVSLIQLASEERIALFHVAMFSKSDLREDLVAPSLKLVMQSPHISKVGVAIKSDCTRLLKFMGIQARGLLELSHLYKLIQHCRDGSHKIDKRLVSLATQAREHLQLPLFKGAVRTSDWSARLNDQQLRYAASDSYAGFRLFDVLEAKRKALNPMPPRPEHAELGLPIRLADGQTVESNDDSEVAVDKPPSDESSIAEDDVADELAGLVIEDQTNALQDTSTTPSKASRASQSPEFSEADRWANEWRSRASPSKVRAPLANLRAFYLWNSRSLDVPETARVLRDLPLRNATVAAYILEAIRLEKLEHNTERLRAVFDHLPDAIRGKYSYLQRRG